MLEKSWFLIYLIVPQSGEYWSKGGKKPVIISFIPSLDKH